VASSEGLPLLFGNRTDVGKVREKNEDYLGYFRVGERHLFIVADGMGGESGGQEASRTAVVAAQSFFEANAALEPTTLLVGAVRAANEACLAIQVAHPELKGMGTTLELLLVEGELSWWAHVGDSRIYLIRDGRAQQLTSDHTRVQQMLEAGLLSLEEAADHPQRHVLSRVVGHDPALQPDVSVQPLEMLEGDALLMCSDGLCDLVSDQEIAWATTRFGPQRACKKLVDMALERGAHDNTTVQVLYRGEAKRSWERAKTNVDLPVPGSSRPVPRKRVLLPLIIGFCAVLGVLAVLAWWWLPQPPHEPGELQPPPDARIDAGVVSSARHPDANTAVGLVQTSDWQLDDASCHLRLPVSGIEQLIGDKPILAYSIKDVRELADAKGREAVLQAGWKVPLADSEVLLVLPFRVEKELPVKAFRTVLAVTVEYAGQEPGDSRQRWYLLCNGGRLSVHYQGSETTPNRLQENSELGSIEQGKLHMLFVFLGQNHGWLAFDGAEQRQVLENYRSRGAGRAERVTVGWLSELDKEALPENAPADAPALSVYDIQIYRNIAVDEGRLAEELDTIVDWYHRRSRFRTEQLRKKMVSQQEPLAGAGEDKVSTDGKLTDPEANPTAVEDAAGDASETPAASAPKGGN